MTAVAPASLSNLGHLAKCVDFRYNESTHFMKDFIMNEKQTKKRIPGYAIVVNKNVDETKAKVHAICDKHNISVSILFEAVIDGLTDEQWAAFAEVAKIKKAEKSKDRKLAKLGFTRADVKAIGQN